MLGVRHRWVEVKSGTCDALDAKCPSAVLFKASIYSILKCFVKYYFEQESQRCLIAMVTCYFFHYLFSECWRIQNEWLH